MDIKDIIKAREKLQTELAERLRDFEIAHGMEIKKVMFRGWNRLNIVGDLLGRSASCRIVMALPDESIARNKSDIVEPNDCSYMNEKEE